MNHFLEFLAVAGVFLFWVTYLVVLRAVAHAKRPDVDASERTSQALQPRANENVVGRPAKSIA